MPNFSIAAGYDFGYPERANLEPLSLLEQILIAPARLFLTMIKLVNKTNTGVQSALTGHVIAVPHDSVIQISNSLPNLNLDGAINIMFIGNKNAWTSDLWATLPLTHPGIFRVNIRNIYNWLNVLKHTHSMYEFMNIVEGNEIEQKLQSISQQLLQQASTTNDEISTHFEEMTSSNIAKQEERVDDQIEGMYCKFKKSMSLLA